MKRLLKNTMNKIQKLQNRKKTLELIKRESLYATRIGCVKLWKGVCYKHFKVMCDIVWKLTSQGYSCITETEFVGGGRADIVAIDMNGIGCIIEVLHSESEKRFELKKDKYPLPIIRVDTKGFDITTWEL